MSRIRRLLLTLLLVALASGALWAAFWQLRRLDHRRASNALLVASRALAPIDLSEALQNGVPLSGRQVIVRGQFIGAGQFLLRGRVQNEVPGMHVVTPLAITGRSEMLFVLRGFVPAPDAATPPADIPMPDSGAVTLSGLLLPIPVTRDAGQPLQTATDTTFRRLDSVALAKRIPGSLPLYLQLDGERTGPGKLPTVPPPTLDEGPHFSYAIQWFGIATAILVFGWVMVWRKKQDGPTP